MEALAERVRRLEPARICIIKPSSLGDIAHSLPILPALRRLFPVAQTTWVVNRSFKNLLEAHPDLDRVLSYERGKSGITLEGFVQTSRLLARLREERFDLVLDLQGLLRSGLMAAATRAEVRVGPADAREGASLFYTHTVEAPRTQLHAVERVLKWAEALGLETPEASFRLPVRAEDRRWARHLLGEAPRPHLILNLGARWLTKRWPPEHFADIARRAVARFGAGLVTVGSADDRPLIDRFRESLGPLPVLDLSGRTSLMQLAALAREAGLFLSNDTGPLHLAAAAGANVVGIYTCTDPRLTGPFGPRAATVRSCVWCAPSFLKTCGRMECLSELSPDRVWPTVEERLSSYQAAISALSHHP
jgi:lipopolysaccharide heptosyltransferase I